MTLILAMANQQQVVLVSDRRLTGNGRVEDESNKAATLMCRNARLAVAFTGLAEAGSFLTRRWLLVALLEAAAPDFLMEPTIRRFGEIASRDFAGIRARPSDKRLSVVFAGYCYGEVPPRCYCWVVSNFEDIDGQQPCRAEASDRFTVQYYRDKRPTHERSYLLLAAGVRNALNHDKMESLRTLLRDNKPAKALVDKGIETLRAAADAARSSQLIGKQCTSIVLPSDPNADAIGEYYSETVASRHYYPSLINARGDGSAQYVIAEPLLEIRGAKGQPSLLSVPKVRRNHPCPCGSGLKFKKCHGRSL